MFAEVLQSFVGLRQRRDASSWSPPAHRVDLDVGVEPFPPPTEVDGMATPKHEVAEGLHVGPSRVIHDDLGVIDANEWYVARRLTVVVGEAPDEARGQFGKGVNRSKRSHEFG